MAVGEWATAAQSLATGLRLAPGSKDMVSRVSHQLVPIGNPSVRTDGLTLTCAMQRMKLTEAQEQEALEAVARKQQQGMARRDLAVS